LRAWQHERQQQTAEVFKSVLLYFERYPITPEPPLLAGKRRQLEETLARIIACANVQVTFPVTDNAKVEGRRKQLREKRMLPLRSIAKGQLEFAPGAEAALRVPHARASARVVAAAALRMADALMPHARLLRSAGVSKDFLREMRHEARGLALTTKQSAEGRRRRREATATIASELKKGLGILSVMEGLIMLHAPREMEQWRLARRIAKKVGRPRTVRRRKPRVALVSST
jgi:hypothetical protein